MSDFLTKILASKKDEVEIRQRKRPLADLKASVSGLPPVRSLKAALKVPGISIIAEIKKASPSAGMLSETFDHRALGSEYEAGGAAALSVLTDKEYFHGALEFLQEVRAVTSLPILRKDFILHEYQIYESRAAGADAMLLIARILDEKTLRQLHETADSIGLETLVEVHNEIEIEKANSIGAPLVGINNRDLSDFSVSIERSLKLRPLIRGNVVTVSESGIRTRDDVRTLMNAGFDAVLVGEGLVTRPDPRQALKELLAE